MPTYSPFLVPDTVSLQVSSRHSVVYNESSFTQVSASQRKRYAVKASFSDSVSKDEVPNLFKIVSQEGMTSSAVALKLKGFKENECVLVPLNHFLQIASLKDWQLLEYVFIFNLKDSCYYLVPQAWVDANTNLRLKIENPVVPSFLKVGDVVKDVYKNEIMWVEAVRPGGVILRYPSVSRHVPYSDTLWRYSEKIDIDALPLPFTTVMCSNSYTEQDSLFLRGCNDIFFEESSPWFNALKTLPAVFDDYISNRSTCFTIRMTPVLSPEALLLLVDQLSNELSLKQRNTLKDIIVSHAKLINLWITLTYRPESAPSDWLFSGAFYSNEPDGKWVFEDPVMLSRIFKVLSKGFRLNVVV